MPVAGSQAGAGSPQGCPGQKPPLTPGTHFIFISGSEWSLKSRLLPLGWRAQLLERMPGSVQGGWAWLDPTTERREETFRKDVNSHTQIPPGQSENKRQVLSTGQFTTRPS